MPNRWFRNLFGRSASPPRQFPVSGFKLSNNIERLEEENWKWYSADAFYPVRIGEVFKARYQVLGKLGYGAHSTAWLARDLQYVSGSLEITQTAIESCGLMTPRAHRYVTLKVCESNSQPARREVAAYKHLNALTTAHSGALLVRQFLDSFNITGSGGEHVCSYTIRSG